MPDLVQLTIDKMVAGGQALATDAAGKKVFVWNALPGETVRARLIKRKRSYDEAIAEDIVTASPERIEPIEANYLATSPWQMMTYAAENNYKKQLVVDIFGQHQVATPPVGEVVAAQEQWHYRNKMEYSFWGDDDGLHLALYQRGTHGKQIVAGSALALPAIDAAAQQVCAQLGQLGVRAGDLKTLVVRCSQAGQVSVALFVKTKTFPELPLGSALQGCRVYYSNPKSPASVMTELLHEQGIVQLHDSLLGASFTYDVDSFFQVNLPIFERALQQIRQHMATPTLIDMYAGVGSIGLSVAQESVSLIELDVATAQMAGVNAAASSLQTEVIETSSEAALDYITAATPLVVDPPRAGLHPKLIARIQDERPPRIAYLSCNPATQARDLALLAEHYDVEFLEIYNFFPRTPHIETLAILSRHG